MGYKVDALYHGHEDVNAQAHCKDLRPGDRECRSRADLSDLGDNRLWRTHNGTNPHNRIQVCARSPGYAGRLHHDPMTRETGAVRNAASPIAGNKRRRHP